MTPLERITIRVGRLGDVNDGKTPRPLLTLAEFFEGNDATGSIAANLTPAPDPAEFYRLLRAIAGRPEVADIRVEIALFDDPGSWPYSDTVWLFTTATPEEVAGWFAAEVRPDRCYRGRTEGPGFEAYPVPEGTTAVACWWD